jgi:glycosyltransferase involved in cell wall biosynthesis
LIKRKGVDVLLRSIALLVDSFPNIRLTIVGKGPEQGGLQRLARQLGISANVFFVDEVDDKMLPSFYHRSAVIVLPSYSEVFGVVILEALAANRPVVATATVGATSILTDRVSGRIVPIGDSKGIADAISSLFSDYKSGVEMAKVGHQLVLSKYGVNVVTKSLEWLYRSVGFSQIME